MVIEDSLTKKMNEEHEFREMVDEKRQQVLERYRYDVEPSDEELGDVFSHKWWRFNKEFGRKLPFVMRYGYFGIVGTGQVIAAGGAFSFGTPYGIIVITLPMIELSLGYRR